ncbi:hypothetical protein DA075_10655 [Methylobacterium currus]|uniref:Uncharacterized protein n=1 Tax=Methylobacterium currus TaxID=2051553 RepID=A0A2R4WIE3_9HYPH|nr:hypothetical protein [Methylobacterium currus]AWB21314.1 hypothetical protein DA075_10655 [Methylobacterium currus]UHC13934.1 hypothetical protein LRS73_15190 [Methylobacterium currus]
MRRLVLVAVLSALLGGPALSQGTSQQATPQPDAPPTAAALLFETNQLANAPPGRTLSYRYTRFSGIDGAPFGPPVEDRIREEVAPGASPENRNLRVEMFSGERRMPTATYEDVPGNPVLVRFLEHHLDDLAKVLKGNPRYIKNAIRRSLRESASVTPAEVEAEGGRKPGWRVVARPFVDDPVRERLRGFDSLTYTFVVSGAVPGQIVSIDARATSPEGGILLQETLTYEPNAG